MLPDRFPPHRPRDRFLPLVTLLCLLVQALIPTGFMPRTDGGAAFELQICNGHHSTDRHHHAPDDSANPDAPCAFAVAGSAAAPPVAVGFTAVVAHAPTILLPSSSPATRPIRHHAQAPRGPPGFTLPA